MKRHSVDGPGWPEGSTKDGRVAHWPRSFASQAAPAAEPLNLQPRLSGRPSFVEPSRWRMGLAAAACLAVCVLVLLVPEPWDLVVAIAVLAAALLWAVCGLYRWKP